MTSTPPRKPRVRRTPGAVLPEPSCTVRSTSSCHHARPMRFALPLLLLAVAPSCIIYVRSNPGDFEVEDVSFMSSEPRVRGDGVHATEVRSVGDFQTLRVSGAIDVEVACGAATGLEVAGDSNVLQYVETDVSDGALRVRLERGSYALRERLVVRLTTPSLMRLEVTGSGDAAVRALDEPRLTVVSQGSGNLSLAGRVDTLELELEGSGDVAATDLACGAVQVDTTGSGDIALGTVEALEARLTGSGDIEYTGRPAILRTEVEGSGSVRAR